MKYRIFYYLLLGALVAPAALARTVTMEEYEANKESFQTPHKYVLPNTSLSPADVNSKYFIAKKQCKKKAGKTKSICMSKIKVTRSTANQDVIA